MALRQVDLASEGYEFLNSTLTIGNTMLDLQATVGNVQSVKWSEKCEHKEVFGNGQRALYITDGQITNDSVEVIMLSTYWDSIENTVRTQLGDQGLYREYWDLTFILVKPNTTQTFMWQMRGKLEEAPQEHKQGADVAITTVKFKPLYVNPAHVGL